MNRAVTRLIIAAALVALQAATVWANSLTLAWDPVPDARVTGYLLAYGTQPGNHPITIDVGNRSSWKVTGLADGERYYFVALAYTSEGLLSPPSSEVDGAAIGIVSLVSNVASTAPTGIPATWTALSGSGASLEYRFWRFSQASDSWSMVRDYSPSNSYSWTPTPVEKGTYSIQVWARLPGSSHDYEVYRSSGMFTISDGPITIGSIETDTPLPVSSGTSVTWRAKAIGGPAPLEYRFWRFSVDSGTWTLVRDYSSSNTYTWTPGVNDAGRYALQVWVKGSGSAADYDAWRSSEPFDVRDGRPVVATLTADVAFPAGTGTPIKWTALAAGGPGPLQYAFWRRRAGGSWQNVRDWNNSNTYSWTPTMEDFYDLQVWVRRPGSVDWEDYAGASFQISNAALAVAGISSDAGPVVGVDRPVTWKVAATGGPGPLEYKFWLYNASVDVWTSVQNYNSSNSFTWTPGASDPGNYVLQVWVRRVGSTADYQAWSSATFTVAATIPGVSSITANVGAHAVVGTPINWTVTSSGGSGLLEYRFWIYDQARSIWTLVQDYSWDNSFGWVPESGDEGTYVVQVWVRRTGTGAQYDAWASSQPLVVTTN
jgi:hypothetical protein